MSQTNYDDYVSFLRRMIYGGARTAEEEFDELYKIANKIWPKVPKSNGNGLKRQFHEFCTYPRENK
jgi:hypothetical protein